MTIYAIRKGDDGPVKIGFTSRNPYGRLRELQTATHERLVLLGVMEGDIAKEHQLHRDFSASNIGREWFRPSKEVMQFCARLLPAHNGGMMDMIAAKITDHIIVPSLRRLNLTDEEVLLILRDSVNKAGSVARYATGKPFSASMVTMTLRGDRKPSQAILDALGLERIRGVDTYRRKRNSTTHNAEHEDQSR